MNHIHLAILFVLDLAAMGAGDVREAEEEQAVVGQAEN